MVFRLKIGCGGPVCWRYRDAGPRKFGRSKVLANQRHDNTYDVTRVVLTGKASSRFDQWLCGEALNTPLATLLTRSRYGVVTISFLRLFSKHTHTSAYLSDSAMQATASSQPLYTIQTRDTHRQPELVRQVHQSSSGASSRHYPVLR